MHICVKDDTPFRVPNLFKKWPFVLVIIMSLLFSSLAIAEDISLDVDGYQQTKQGTYKYQTCGAACSLMILNYSNCAAVSNMDDVSYYINYLGSGNNRGLENICAQINKHLGQSPYSVYWNCTSVSDLENRVKNSLSLKRPLIASINSSNAAYAACSNIYNSSDPVGHYVVISGMYYNSADSKTYFEVKDPMCSVTKIVHVPSNVLYDAMPYPNNGYQHPIIYGTTSNTSTSFPIISYENCTYKIIKDTTLRKEPFDSAAKGSTVYANKDIVTSVALIDNGTNYWLQLTNDEYIYAGYTNKGVQTGNQYLEFVKDNSACTSSGGWNLPSGNLTPGKGFELKGDFSYSSSIVSVEAEVYKANSSTLVKESIGTTANKKTRSYSIYTSTVNTGLPFSQLSAGDYRIDIKVNYYYNRGQITSKVINSSTFSVGSSNSTASTLQFSNVTYPKTFRINTTNGWALGSGTLVSNYELKTLTTKIVNSSGTALSSATKTISGYSYSIISLDTYSSTDNGVKFSKITSAGSYKWILTATDSAGRTLTLEMPFTAVSSGTTSTATASKTYTDKVSVTGVTVDLDDVTLREGQQTYITATVSPSNATNKAITWSSNNTTVATVASATSTSATITAQKGGTATITCTTSDGSYKATCKITVTTSVTGISLSPSTLTLEQGKTSALTATIAPSGATNKSVHWYTSNSSVATVTNGVVKGVGAGTATITAMSEDGGYTANCTVTIVVPVTKVTLNASSATLNVGNTTTLTATVAPSNATNKNVSWSSSNTAVATVSGGKVTAVANGTATITCKTADGGYTATCTVTVKTPVSGITLDRDSAILKAGESFTLVPTVLPSTASNKTVTWSSGNTAVATVANGKVTAGSNGTASIYCSTEEGGYQVYCKVYVIDPVDLGDDFYAVIRHMDSGKLVDAESISNLANIHLTTEIFNESQIWHFVRQSDGYYKILQGEYLMELAGGNIADDTNIRLYRENDNAAQHWYIHKDGEGYHLTSRKATGSCVDVRGNNSADGTNVQLFTENNTEGQRFSIEKCTLVSSLRLDANKIELNSIGESKSVTATVLPSNATYRNIIWASDDLAVATVVDGTVVAVGSGITTITCTIDGSGHSASCRVIVYGEKLLKLPGALLQIDAEAFRYSIMDAVIVPEKAESIGSKAFADCDDLRIIYMPDSVVQIAEDAFDGSDNVCFVCESENAAATYAKKHSIPYVVE